MQVYHESSRNFQPRRRQMEEAIECESQPPSWSDEHYKGIIPALARWWDWLYIADPHPAPFTKVAYTVATPFRWLLKPVAVVAAFRMEVSRNRELRDPRFGVVGRLWLAGCSKMGYGLGKLSIWLLKQPFRLADGIYNLVKNRYLTNDVHLECDCALLSRTSNSNPKPLAEDDKSKDWRVRLSVARNVSTSSEILDRFAGDVSSVVRLAVAENPHSKLVTLERLSTDSVPAVSKAAKKTAFESYGAECAPPWAKRGGYGVLHNDNCNRAILHL